MYKIFKLCELEEDFQDLNQIEQRIEDYKKISPLKDEDELIDEILSESIEDYHGLVKLCTLAHLGKGGMYENEFNEMLSMCDHDT